MRRTLVGLFILFLFFGCSKKGIGTVRGLMNRDGINLKSVQQTVDLIRELDQRQEIRLLDDTYSLARQGVLPLGEEGFQGTFEYLEKDYFYTSRIFKTWANVYFSQSGTKRGGASLSFIEC